MELIRTALGLGLLLGLKHALEADHVVAVSTIVSEHRSLRRGAVVGIFWGLGHTTTLFLVGAAVILFRLTIPDRLALAFEFGVGLMLVLLGLLTLRSYRERNVHLHVHEHDGTRHPHFHVHPPQDAHQTHDHHPFPHEGKSYLVGLVHGLAGSAALVLLVLTTIPSPWLGVLYVLLFGLGSIAGMLAVSAVLALPFIVSARRFDRAHSAITLAAGIASVVLGLAIMGEVGPRL